MLHGIPDCERRKLVHSGILIATIDIIESQLVLGLIVGKFDLLRSQKRSRMRRAGQQKNTITYEDLVVVGHCNMAGFCMLNVGLVPNAETVRLIRSAYEELETEPIIRSHILSPDFA